jgi:hypothetical protein
MSLWIAQQHDPNLLAHQTLFGLASLGKLGSLTDEPGIGQIEKHRSEAAVLLESTATHCPHQLMFDGLELSENSMDARVVELSRRNPKQFR